MSLSETLSSLIGPRKPLCPNEAEVLAYSESRLSVRNRAHLERHFAGCDDCRELLVVLGRESAETHMPLPDEALREQTSKVLSMIHADDLNRGKPERSKPEHKPRTFPGFDVPYLRLAGAALIICTVSIIGIELLSKGQKPADAAMQALALAVKDSRHTEARVSGGLVYSRYSVMRGVETNDDELQFNRAISKLSFADQDTAPVNDKLVLARVYLTRGTPEDLRHARKLLDELATRGVETAEVLNDLGVAQFELHNYEDAIAYFTSALGKSPTYYEALFNRALAGERARHNDQARQDWERFIDQSSDDSWKSEARMRLNSLTGVSDR
jgi:tetratricopeptide (TPR) repeat protein